MGEARLLLRARRRHSESIRSVTDELRRLREDAGLSQASVARAARIARSHLSQIEAGRSEPSLVTLHRVATVLGCDLSVRLFPNSGPAIRDRHQARMVEALLRILHPRWTARLEVPVHRPVRGVIDVVLEDRAAGQHIATEVHSDLRRVEQQLRWSHQKTEALALALAETAGVAPGGATPAVSRLVILRSTARSRALTSDLAATFLTELPADPRAALRALTAADPPWPGPALLFANVHGTVVSLFARRAGANASGTLTDPRRARPIAGASRHPRTPPATPAAERELP